MMPGVLLQHIRSELDFFARMVGNANGSAGTERPVKLNPDEYCDLLWLLLEFPHAYQQTVESEIRRVFSERSRTVEQLRQARAELESTAAGFTDVIRMLQADADLRAFATAHPGLEAALAKLGEAIETLQRSKTQVTDEWPVCSQEEQTQIPAERQQRRFTPVDLAFADMKGISITELHQKLEEHKARRKEYGWE